jgi:hypothetical protein
MLLRIVSSPVEIRTVHLANTSEKRYCVGRLSWSSSGTPRESKYCILCRVTGRPLEWDCLQCKYENNHTNATKQYNKHKSYDFEPFSNPPVSKAMQNSRVPAVNILYLPPGFLDPCP